MNASSIALFECIWQVLFGRMDACTHTHTLIFLYFILCRLLRAVACNLQTGDRSLKSTVKGKVKQNEPYLNFLPKCLFPGTFLTSKCAFKLKTCLHFISNKFLVSCWPIILTVTHYITFISIDVAKCTLLGCTILLTVCAQCKL